MGIVVSTPMLMAMGWAAYYASVEGELPFNSIGQLQTIIDMVQSLSDNVETIKGAWSSRPHRTHGGKLRPSTPSNAECRVQVAPTGIVKGKRTVYDVLEALGEPVRRPM